MGFVTKFVHTQEPKIYHPNGLLMDKEIMPNKSATTLLINHLLHDMFIILNPRCGHKCTRVCYQPTQILIGYPKTEDLRNSCPSGCAEMVEQYEDLLSSLIDDEEWEVNIQTLVIEFLPCSEVLEILAVAIYL